MPCAVTAGDPVGTDDARDTGPFAGTILGRAARRPPAGAVVMLASDPAHRPQAILRTVTST